MTELSSLCEQSQVPAAPGGSCVVLSAQLSVCLPTPLSAVLLEKHPDPQQFSSLSISFIAILV